MVSTHSEQVTKKLRKLYYLLLLHLEINTMPSSLRLIPSLALNKCLWI